MSSPGSGWRKVSAFFSPRRAHQSTVTAAPVVFWSDSAKEELGRSAEGLLWGLFSSSFQSGIDRNVQELCRCSHRNRSGPSAGSGDLMAPEYSSSVAEVVSNSDYR